MYVTKATKQDFAAIKALHGMYGKMTITRAHLNKRDISIKCCDEDGSLIGFGWAGLMANGSIAYVALCVTHPDYRRCGVQHNINTELLKECKKRGVKSFFGVVEHDEYLRAQAINCLKMAVGSHAKSHMLVGGDLDNMVEQISKLGK